MTFAQLPIQEISTLAILVPLLLSLRFILTAEIEFRLFFIFLLIGLLTDLFGWYTFSHQDLIGYLLYATTFYSVLESIFFTWWITRFTPLTTIRSVGRIVMVINACWICYLFINGITVSGTISRLTFFDAFYQTAVSFLSGFVLLAIIEKEEKPHKLPAFWILIGMFVYCFSTFFIFVMKSSVAQEFADKLWPVHDVVNIITYLLYSIGLWKYRGLSKA